MQSVVENRSSNCYMSDRLSKINLDLHDQLNKVMMFGACFLAIFFEALRGQERLEFLKQTNFKLTTQTRTPWVLTLLAAA